MNNKYKLTDETIKADDRILYRIQAIKDFNDVKTGDLGGFIENEFNLSFGENDDSWIYDNSRVYNNSSVSNNSRVWNNSSVYDNSRVWNNSCVKNNSRVWDNSRVYDNSRVDKSRVWNNSCVDNSSVDNSCVKNNSRVWNNSRVNNSIINNGNIQSSNDCFSFSSFGSENRTTTFYKHISGEWYVRCGCFNNSIDEFEQQVKETHGDNKFSKQYLKMIEYAKFNISLF